MQPSSFYTIGFAAAVCGVCSIFVSGAAVGLKPLQEENKVLDRQKKVLVVAGLMEEGEAITPDEVRSRFDSNIRAQVVDLDSGKYDSSVDAANYDQRKAAKDPATSETAPDNPAKVQRVPHKATIYEVLDGDKVDGLILPIQGMGLWSTLYGFVALDDDCETIAGITFYEHAETPGLGGEVDNPSWKKLWKGRKAFNPKGEVAVRVIKGIAGDAKSDPYSVDGLSGATLTSNGVTNALEFWLGPQVFKPYLDNFRSGKVKG